MKKNVMRFSILSFVFVVAAIVSSMILNRGTSNKTVDFGDQQLARISFDLGESSINTLVGYVEEMNLTAMRDTITPLQEKGILTGRVEGGDEIPKKLEYTVYSLDGQKEYRNETAQLEADLTFQCNLRGAIPIDADEAVLKLTLIYEMRAVNYYTRIIEPDDLNAKECLAFAKEFQTKTFNTKNADELSMYLELSDEADNNTLQTVSIACDVEQLTWGKLSPTVAGEVEWSIKEINTVYSSMVASYRVTAINEQEETEVYDVKEFYRVRYLEGEYYLLNYNRTMNEVFQTSRTYLTEKGILLGVTSDEVSYKTNKDATLVAFIQERDLWLYDQKNQEISMIFSFSNQEGDDAQSRYDQHSVRLISMDEDGNVVFAVSGYMNRGTHEGEVGVNIFVYHKETNLVEEKAFIASRQSFAMVEEEFGKMVYYNDERSMLYVLAMGALYQIACPSGEEVILADALEEGQYVVSEDGHLLAYQVNGSFSEATQVKLLNLQTGEEQTIEAGEGESVRPLGFIKDDFIYGYHRLSDRGVTVSGESILPMYAIEIVDTSLNRLKMYQEDGLYISDLDVEQQLVTLHRWKITDGVYTPTTQDYISSNEERTNVKVTLESFYSNTKQTQMRLTFTEGLEKLTANELRPKQVSGTSPLCISFVQDVPENLYYVYGMGQFIGSYEKPAYALLKADEMCGVVVDSKQAYVWEKGNRNLTYYNDVDAFTARDGESSLEACERIMESYDATMMHLTGCSLNQILYIVDQGMPVIAMTDASHAILITGYSIDTVTYLDPTTGGEYTVTTETMEDMVKGSGNTFLGYRK